MGVTLEELRQLSVADKILILMAYDTQSMKRMDSHPSIRYSRVNISLAGRRGLLDYSEEELDSELEDYAEDLASVAESVDSLVGWAQHASGVLWVDPEKREWKYRPNE